jgi:hypothetical protein
LSREQLMTPDKRGLSAESWHRQEYPAEQKQKTSLFDGCALISRLTPWF